ncbi:MAG: hypothetical protein KJO24_00550 [Gammaproteobacteria bacterium]|nr:hypothetical protein [Gammaproteobacteria bacterium]
MPFSDDAKLAKVQELAASEQYARALRIVDKQIAKQHEPQQQQQWQQLAGEINREAEQFRRDQSSRIDQLVSRLQWPDAHQRVQSMREQLPASDALDRYLLEYERQRQRFIDRQNAALLLLQARYLPEQIELLDKLAQAQPGNSRARKQLQRHQREREGVLGGLQQQLAAAREAGQLDTALMYARAVAGLAPSAKADALVADLQSRLASSAAQAASAAAMPNRQNDLLFQKQLNEYGRALVNEQWLQARAVLDALLKARPGDSELQGQDTYLNEVFTAQVDAAKKSGEQLYSSGEIEQALELWRAVLPMAPDDAQLTGNIERAQRILSKVKALKEESR